MSQLSFPRSIPVCWCATRTGAIYRHRPTTFWKLRARVIDRKMRRGAEFTSPAAVRNTCVQSWPASSMRVFVVLFMDTRHRLIEYGEMFHGTIDGASVYPREVVKEALRLNAAAVVVSHYVPRHIMRIMCPVFYVARHQKHSVPQWSPGTGWAHNGSPTRYAYSCPFDREMIVLDTGQRALAAQHRGRVRGRTTRPASQHRPARRVCVEHLRRSDHTTSGLRPSCEW